MYKSHYTLTSIDTIDLTLQGKVQVISASGLHELHIFIFVLAVVHVLYSCVTVLLSLWQVSEHPTLSLFSWRSSPVEVSHSSA